MAPPQELLTVQVEHNTMQPADTLNVKARRKAGRRIEIINSKTINVWEQWGNTFDVNTVKYGHARKVWREIRHRYPGGGMVSNISDWVAVGKIPAGTAVKFDLSGKTFTAYTDAQIKAAESDITTLGINGYLQEDILVASGNTKASGTVVYAGEIYQYMFDEEVVAILQKITTLPQIVWVQ